MTIDRPGAPHPSGYSPGGPEITQIISVRVVSDNLRNFVRLGQVERLRNAKIFYFFPITFRVRSA